MKETFYMLKNNSKSEGTYLIDGEYKPIYPGETITLRKAPVNYTNNVIMVMYRKETGRGEILYKKPVIESKQEDTKKPASKKKA